MDSTKNNLDSIENNNKKNTQTFLQATFVLVLANIVVKIIGAIFKFPIGNLLGGTGYANYQDAYTLYTWFFTVSTAGLPVAISRMVSVANMNKNYAEEKKIFKLAFASFAILGAFGTALMFFGAKAYSNFIINPEAYLSMMVLAPTVFFVCMTSAFRGYFQGHTNMTPTAISEIIEALCKLGIGLGAAVYAINKYGADRLDIAAAYAVSGLTVGVAGGSLFLFIRKKIYDRKFNAEIKINNKINNNSLKARPSKEILREIWVISLPIMLSASVVALSGVIDSAIMKRRLEFIGWAHNAAVEAYGDYMLQANTLFSFPNSTLIVPLAVAVIPIISAAYSQKNKALIESTVESTFRVTSVLALPCAFGLASLSKPILNMFFAERGVAPLLSVLSISIMFVAFVSVTNSMLQAQKQEFKTIISMICGILVKIVSSWILIGIPSIGRFGTPIGTCLCYLTIVSINFYFMIKYTGVKPPIRRTFIKPFLASAVMGLSAVLSYMLFNRFINAKLATFGAIFVAVAVYATLIIAFKTMTKADVLLLPKGEKIYRLMKSKNWID